MRVDATVATGDFGAVGELAGRLEADGYDGLFTVEASHNPFLPLVAAAEHTKRLELGTSIAVAFARNPMDVAHIADDLQRHSGGRFILGIGSQIKPHITRRFSMPWSRPADRMREFVAAIRAIWRSWATDEPLEFRGDFYEHTLMTPFFSPGENPHGNPPIFLAAVGPAMTRVAGELCDGLFVHPFTTPRYLRERIIPALDTGLRAGGRPRSSFQISCQMLIGTGKDDRQLDAARHHVRGMIAFYGSTPAYRPVLDLHGWGDLADELNRVSRTPDRDRWERMSSLVGDDVLETFAVVVEPARLAGAVLDRVGGLVDRVNFSMPYPLDAPLWSRVPEQIKRLSVA